jgi:hypothetical protein
MKELATLLRQFADRVESGKQLKDTVHCAVILGNRKGETQATYIGQEVPAQAVGISLCAGGIQNWASDIRTLVVRGTTKGSS